VGAKNLGPNNQGAVYIYLGCTSFDAISCNIAGRNPSSTNQESIRRKLLGEPIDNSHFGFAVSINSHGVVVVGTMNGRAYVYYGCLSMSSTSCIGNNKVTLTGPANSNFGYSVDVNAVKTIVVGAPDANNKFGAAYVYYGAVTDTASSSVGGVTNNAEPSGKLLQGFNIRYIKINTHSYSHILQHTRIHTNTHIHTQTQKSHSHILKIHIRTYTHTNIHEHNMMTSLLFFF